VTQRVTQCTPAGNETGYFWFIGSGQRETPL